MDLLDNIVVDNLNITQLKNLKKQINEKINLKILEIREINKSKIKKNKKRKIVRPPIYISESSDDEM